jgi:3-hydroxymyristoyl/3-hydroxydecanoyl-(acyl carrier protein) dehydratase
MTIPPDHPALAGHFPGNPIVPGVVLLDEVLRAAGLRCARLSSVKFHTPLRPGEEFTIRIEKQKFSVQRGETLIVSGSLALA